MKGERIKEAEGNIPIRHELPSQWNIPKAVCLLDK